LVEEGAAHLFDKRVAEDRVRVREFVTELVFTYTGHQTGGGGCSASIICESCRG